MIKKRVKILLIGSASLLFLSIGMAIIDLCLYRPDFSFRRVKTEASSISDIIARVESRFPLIDSMVRTISGGEVKVRLGEEWAYSLALKIMTCPPAELGFDEFRFSIAKVFHELGHWAADRVVDDFFFLSETRKLLLNGVSDPRVNEYQMSQYSGLRENYMLPLYYEQWCKPYESRINLDSTGALPHEQYIDGLIYRWVKGVNNPAIVNTKVLDAIERSWEEYKALINIYPQGANVTEDEIIRQNQVIHQRILDNLWPIYQELIEESQKQIEQNIRDGKIGIGEGGGDSRTIPDELISDEAKRIIEERSRDMNKKLEPAIAKPEGKDAEKPLKDAQSQGQKVDPVKGVENPRAQDSDQAGQGKSQGDNSDTSSNANRGSFDDSNSVGIYNLTAEHQHPHYFEYLKKLSTIIDQTTEYLRNVLQLSSYPYYESGFSSGRRINIKRWLQREYTGKIDFFDRRESPDERDYSIELVIDQSGSMSGEKAIDALDSTVVFMETLSRLAIDFGIIGFSDEVKENGVVIIPTLRIHKEFGNIPDLAERERIIQELEELMARGGTDDYQALQLAMEKVGARKTTNKLIVVLSDGEGNLDRNRDLLEQAEARGIKVIGIGIGEGMQYVSEVYKHYVTVSELKDLPAALRDILIREIIGF